MIQNIYVWFGFDARGRYRTGKVRARSSHVLKKRLHRIGILVVSISLSLNMLGSIAWWQSMSRLVRGRRRLSFQNAALICHHMATLYTTRLPLHEILLLILPVVPIADELLWRMHDDLLHGASFAYAVTQSAAWWPPLVVTTLQSSGATEREFSVLLGQLSDALSVRDLYAKKMWQALMGPLITLVVAIGVFAALIGVVLPQLMTITTTLDTAHPLFFTTITFLQHYGLLCLIVALGGVFMCWQLLAFHIRLRCIRDRLLFYIPLCGTLLRLYHGLLFLRMFVVLIRAEVVVPQALLVLAKSSSNAAWADALQKATILLEKGESLSSALQATGAFFMPTLFLSACSLAHSSNDLAQLCEHAIVVLDRELQHVIEMRLSLLQPALLVAIGGGVAYGATIVLEPLLSINLLGQ